MSNSSGVEVMMVFAISGSVVLVALQVHKRLLSNFMKKLESEFVGIGKCRSNKKVQSTNFVQELSSGEKEHQTIRQSGLIRQKHGGGGDYSKRISGKGSREGPMQPNRLALYKGIIQYRMLKSKISPSGPYVYNKFHM